MYIGQIFVHYEKYQPKPTSYTLWVLSITLSIVLQGVAM